MGKILKKTFIILISFFLMHQISIIIDGLHDDSNPSATVAIVLGSKVNTDGTLSKRLKARCDRGLKLYTDSLVKEIYVSGGLGKEGYYEGTVMATYLISQGIPEKYIKIDNQGVNTRASALNFRTDYPNESSVIVVSQFFHISRCKLAFKQVGIGNVFGVSCDHFTIRDPYSLLREFFGYYKYLLFYEFDSW